LLWVDEIDLEIDCSLMAIASGEGWLRNGGREVILKYARIRSEARRSISQGQSRSVGTLSCVDVRFRGRFGPGWSLLSSGS